MKKVLFIDRDGTILKEPIEDEQIDSFEKFEFLPHTISSLQKIVENTDYDLVWLQTKMGGNRIISQDTFWPVQTQCFLFEK